MTGFAPTGSTPTGTGPSAAPGGATYTLLGNTAVFSAVFSGQAAQDHDLKGTTATYGLTFAPATMTVSYPLNGTTATFSLVPAAATITQPRRGLGGDTATYGLSLTATGRRNAMLNGSTSAFALSGGTSSFLSGYSVTGQTGVFGLSYQLAAAASRRLVGDPQTVTIVGGKAKLAYRHQLHGDPAAFAITPAAALMRPGYVLNGASARFGISPGVATLRAGRVVTGAPAGYAAVPGAAVLLAVHKLNGDSRTLNLTYQLGVSRNRAVAGQPGSVALSGGPARVGVSRKLAGQTGSFLITRPNGVASVRRALAGSPAAFSLVGATLAARTQKPPLVAQTAHVALSYAPAVLARPQRVLKGDTAYFDCIGGAATAISSGAMSGLLSGPRWLIESAIQPIGSLSPPVMQEEVPMQSYDLGQQLVFSTTITDPGTGLPVSPGLVVLKLLAPDGTIATPPVTNPSTGLFTSTYTPALAGRWVARWQSTGTVSAATEYQFEISPSAFT